MAISVLPTPVDPTNSKDATGLLFSFKPALERLIDLTTISTALSCPYISDFISESKVCNISISLLEIVTSGILAIDETTFSISFSDICTVMSSSLQFILAEAPASSITSIALSGKNLSFIYLLESLAANSIDFLEYLTL